MDDFEESSWRTKRNTFDDEDLYEADIINADEYVESFKGRRLISSRESNIIQAARQQRTRLYNSFEADSYIPIRRTSMNPSASHRLSGTMEATIDLEDIYEQPEYQNEAFDEEDMWLGATAARQPSLSHRKPIEDYASESHHQSSDAPQYKPSVPIPSLRDAISNFVKKAQRKRIELDAKATERKRIIYQKTALEDEIRDVSRQLEGARIKLSDLERGVGVRIS